MQVISNVLDFTKVAAALSLSIANYKPEPVLPSNSVNVSSTGGRVSSVQSPDSWQSSHPANEWGQPSVLHIPQSSGRNAAGNKGGSGKTVGSHGCLLRDEYTPNNTIQVEFPSFNRTRANLMRYRKQVGVNGGSWFVNEQWMAPSMFECAAGKKSAELDIVKGFGTSKNGIQSARSFLEKHWDTWIQESDFKDMRDAGINTIRIPIGYWILPGSNFTSNSDFEKYGNVYVNAYKYLRRAIYWADKYDIGVLVDMHGAYGSQNGQDHSGISTGQVNFFNKQNEKLTANALKWLVNDLVNVTNVIGLELLNEPSNENALWTWYGNTMDDIRKMSPEAAEFPLYYHDAFSPSQGAKFASQRSDFVVQDTHSYFVFTQQDKDMSASKHTTQIKGAVEDTMNQYSLTARGNYIVGEWSCALNPSSLSGSSNSEKSTSQFCEAQLDTYRNTSAGMHFWSWTMENCKQNSGWCFKASLPQYLSNAYNAWDSSALKSSTISKVASNISTAQLPDKYASAKTAVSSKSSSCKAGSNSSSSASSNASAGSSSGARNAAVNKNSSKSSSHSSSHSATHSSKHSSTHSSTHSSKHHHTSDKHHHTSDKHHHTSSKHHHSSSKHHSSTAKHTSHHSRRVAKVLGSGDVVVPVEKRATSVDASQLGYADGFLSAKVFAGSQLSRLGFTQQFAADTASYYNQKNIIDKRSVKSYNKEFNTGLSKLEANILSVVKN